MSTTLREGESVSASLKNGSLKRKRANTEPFRALKTVDVDEIHDLICVGFGPASLAIAIALRDALEDTSNPLFQPKVCFVEQQPEFRWHAGMMLPDAKMQISFLKDMATLRNPRSYFTFLNYLKTNSRLVQFTNLGTFLPSRLEFSDYMKWCSSAFDDVVQYGSEVLQIGPTKIEDAAIKYDLLSVQYRTAGQTVIRRSRNLIIAVGGRPQVPAMLPLNHFRVIHSSVYASQISEILKVREKAYNIGVLGGGQSAAEVFNDLHSRYPNANTYLIFRDTALRPSDDSPFVNEIFDDDRITPFYNQPTSIRDAAIAADKSTNYSVVRLELLEKIYYDLYQQRIEEADPEKWRHRILPAHELVQVIDIPQNKRINVVLKNLSDTAGSSRTSRTTLNLDLLVYATGYTRDTHNELLQDCQVINASTTGQWEVRRDYSVKLDGGFVEDGVKIYLQGCNEASHGLSDSLISVLATRGGEVVESIFGGELRKAGGKDGTE